ncbi:MAG TPA: TonB-dependent receptor [Puia sp.]|uniref:SusC/RagA family TonB-linked outer membrane protein n=1 Tax=Puia sp. TaxID=2045100 RepID=UPI002CB0DFC3|nr:TonB-dependent receptor [Puia sp.]HVU94078.1 TonB-dependent receptor [Puia sp.]
MRKVQIVLPLLLLSLLAFAQQKVITGTVVKSTTKEPLEGVTVHAGAKSVMTDAAGHFSIPASPGETITLSYVGMNNLQVKVTPATTELSLAMIEGINDLNQVVVTGYKSEKKVDLTGAVSVVNLAAIKDVPTTSPMLALQGQVPGLYIAADGSPTGSNGNPPTILVRGVNTLGNTNPLYIIDGVPTTRYEDFANLNSATIASIQVLKDASASSIYGSRASNGVIIVTTKDGSTAGDKLHVSLNSNATWQTERPWQEKVLNSEDRGKALWRAAVNDGTDPNNLVNQIYTFDWNNDYTNPVLNKVNIAPFVGGSQLEPVGNTNWQNELYKTALITQNDIGIAAGNSRNGVSMDFGYLNNDGLLQYTYYRRYNARINSHVSGFNNRLKIGENFQLSRTTQVGSATDVGGAWSPTLALILAPTIPLRKTDGTYGGPIGPGYTDRNNPVDVQYLNRWNTNNRLQLYGNLYAELEVIKKLVLRTSFGFDYDDEPSRKISLIGNEGPVQSFNSLTLTQAKEFTFTWTNTANYNLEIGEHRLNILGGIESVHDDYQVFNGSVTNFALQDLDYFQLGSGSGTQTTTGSATGYRLLSQFGKLFYGYADRYLASFTLRRDGSSRFGTNNPYGYFPAGTIGWRINNEDFFRNVHWVSNLKLRGGYGIVGNQAIGNLSAYTLFQSNYGTSNPAYPAWLNTGTAYDLNGTNTGTLPSGFVQTQLGNPNLKWEQTKETNIGIDFGFMNESLTGSFDWFNRNTSNILIQPPIAAAVGEGQQQWLNGASINNKGWEFVLSYQNTTAGKFHYTVTGNLSHFSNVITQLPEDVRSAYPGDPNHSIIGHSQYSVFGYKANGIFQNAQEVSSHASQPGAAPGRIRYDDLDGNGKVDVLDQTWLGTTLPKLLFGIRFSADYKNFDVSLFGSGVASVTVYDPAKGFNTTIAPNTNAGPGVFSAWTPQNTKASIPALTVLNLNNEGRTSNYYFVNGSFFKLRNAMLGYTLPKTVAAKAALQSLRLYVSGQNLFAIKSGKLTSKDPERTNFNSWPVPTSVTVGINANF